MVFTAFLEITYHASNIYIHEIALHPDHDAEDFRPPFFIAVKLPSTQSQTILTPPFVNAIIQCMSSADALLSTFLNMSVKEILRCPTLVYVRVIYAVVILIKLSISTSMPSSELGKIISQSSNKIDTFLDKLLIHFRAVATLEQGGKHVLSSVFLRILTKLKLWFEHQKNQPCGSTIAETSSIEGEKNGVLDEDPWSPPSTEPTEASVNYDQEAPYSFADPPQPTTQSTSNFQVQASDKIGFFPDYNTPDFLGLNTNNLNQQTSQPMQAASWPTSFQPNPSYSEPLNPNYQGYPMDLDPNLWTHLANAELDQNRQDNVMYDADSYANLDYTAIPEFNWGTWPQQ